MAESQESLVSSHNKEKQNETLLIFDVTGDEASVISLLDTFLPIGFSGVSHFTHDCLTASHSGSSLAAREPATASWTPCDQQTSCLSSRPLLAA